MKKIVKFIALLFFVLSTNGISAIVKEIKVGATSRPHAEILEFVKPMLASKGINLKIVIFQDYVLPNIALSSKDLDANFFQHEQYLKSQMEMNGYNFVNLQNVHIEPIGIYSKKYKSLVNIKPYSTIVISSSASDRTRILLLLEKSELLTFKEGTDKSKADFKDIESTELVFKPEVSPALLPRLYLSNEADLVVINTNYAIAAGINPTEDALIIEGKDSRYFNILVAREENKDDYNLIELSNALVSQGTKQFIINKYKGSIIPVE